MKIALLGDVHANLPALDAVLAHAYGQSIDAIWNIGDWLGYNPYPNEVIDLLRQASDFNIVGNYDLKVLGFKKKQDGWQAKKHPLKYRAFQWAYETLSKKNRRYLRTLPREITLNFGKRSVLLTHGSPASNKEALSADTPEHRLRELADVANTDLIVCGHSHRPFARQVGATWFINTGSVGRPDDGDPRASYAVLTLKSKSVEVEHFRLTYNIGRVVKKLRAEKLPAEFGEMLRRGCNLDELERLRLA
jgi:putative phosphoesterase